VPLLELRAVCTAVVFGLANVADMTDGARDSTIVHHHTARTPFARSCSPPNAVLALLLLCNRSSTDGKPAGTASPRRIRPSPPPCIRLTGLPPRCAPSVAIHFARPALGGLDSAVSLAGITCAPGWPAIFCQHASWRNGTVAEGMPRAVAGAARFGVSSRFYRSRRIVTSRNNNMVFCLILGSVRLPVLPSIELLSTPHRFRATTTRTTTHARHL